MARREIGTIWDRKTRNDINENFIELYNEYIGAGLDAKEAKQKAEQALNVANQSKQQSQRAENKADSVQNQLDQIVIEGDSSVEAAQARVDTYGTTYDTLKERLDANDNFVSEMVINLKAYGAIGDGVDGSADVNTQALKNALQTIKNNGGGYLKIPAGHYKINDTIEIPSNTTIIGDGKTATRITAVSGTNFPVRTPLEWDNMSDVYRYRALFVTESAGVESNVGRVVNITIKGLSLDWNNCPGGNNSTTVLLMDRADDVLVDDVWFRRALAQDLTDTLYHGSNTLISFSNHVTYNRCEFSEADYETVSVRYLSKMIYIKNSVFKLDKDTSKAMQRHAIQLARPSDAAPTLRSLYGEEKAGPLFVENNHVYVGNNVQGAITSHYGKGFYCRNNYTEPQENAHFYSYAFKPFDNTEDVVISGNVEDARKAPADTPTFVGGIRLDERIGNSFEACRNVEISNNKILLDWSGYQPHPSDAYRCIIGGGGGAVTPLHYDVRIVDNYIEIKNARQFDFTVIRSYTSRGVVSGNIIMCHTPVDENGQMLNIDNIDINNGGAIGIAFSAGGQTITNNIIGRENPSSWVARGIFASKELDDILGPSREASNVIISNNAVGSAGIKFSDNYVGEGEFENTVHWVNNIGDKSAYIVETGTNENGKFIKYSDGTLICTGVANLTYVNHYLLGTDWQLPHMMNNTPEEEFFASVTLKSANAIWNELPITPREISFAGINNFYNDRVQVRVASISTATNFSSEDTMPVNVYVVGRWK